jgi:tetratricopeptide (TPR) repeat protein
LGLRARCLEDHSATFEEVIRELRRPDESLVKSALGLVSIAGQLDECGEERVRAAPTPPAQYSDAVYRIERAQVRAGFLVQRGKFEEAHAVAEELVKQAEQIPYPPLHARILRELGTLEARRRDPKQAETTLLKALHAAQEGGSAEDELRTWTQLAQVRGYLLADPVRGRELAAHARALLRRLGNPPIYERSLASVMTMVAYRDNSCEEALQNAERALELSRAEHTGDTVLSVALNDVGSAHGCRHDYLKAVPFFEEAIALADRTYGAGHAVTSASLNNLAHSLLQLGRTEEALPIAERAVAISERAYGPSHQRTASALSYHALGLARAGRTAEGVQEARRSVEIAEKSFPRPHAVLGSYDVRLAQAMVAHGDTTGAAQVVRRLLADQDTLGNKDAGTRAAALALQGRVELASHQAARARRTLTEARALLARPERTLPASEKAFVELLYAQALWDSGASRKEAIAVAPRAEQTLEAPGGNTEHLLTVRAWLSGKAP